MFSFFVLSPPWGPFNHIRARQWDAYIYIYKTNGRIVLYAHPESPMNLEHAVKRFWVHQRGSWLALYFGLAALVFQTHMLCFFILVASLIFSCRIVSRPVFFLAFRSQSVPLWILYPRSAHFCQYKAVTTHIFESQAWNLLKVRYLARRRMRYEINNTIWPEKLKTQGDILDILV